MSTMHSVLLPFDLSARRDAVAQGGTLGELADSLSRDLHPLLARQLPVPPQKAKLTRIGGRCPVHGTLLDFDPYRPYAHRCDRCDREYVAREHDDYWAMGAQLWTAERAVHASALYALRGDEAHAALATQILGTLAERYASWPNRDNVLGPSRPFFSTYLESIWLLNVCHALALLEAAGADGVHAMGATVRDRLIEPSATLIAGFHEGNSNRQVWNEVAVLSALRLLDDRTALDHRLQARGGFAWLVRHGVLDDGTWFEGENYHLFAHRGLWYGVQLLRALGQPLDASLYARYHAGFLTPFTGVLPDDTFPSRRDSQYAVSIRQWRLAEWCELGYAASHDERLAAVLTRLYDGQAPSGDTTRWCSTADAERNSAPVALTRADCSWRALLAASEVAPPECEWNIQSACLPAQGLAVLRRDRARTYIALEGGHDGGGHGHPDRLALTLQTGAARWLEDPGTGSYVDPTLHWYRSTLAHNAPLVDGRSQATVPGELLAFDERGGAGWIWKRATDVVPGLILERTIVAADGYLVDLVEWHRVNMRRRRDDLPTASTSLVDPGEAMMSPVPAGAHFALYDRDLYAEYVSEAAPNGAMRTDAPEVPAPIEAPIEHEVMLPIAGVAELVPAPEWIRAVLRGAGGLEDGFEHLDHPEVSPLGPRVNLRARPTFSRVPSVAEATEVDGAPTDDAPLSELHAAVWYAANVPGVVVRAKTPGAPGQPSTQRHWLRVRGASGVIAGVWCWPTDRTPSLNVRDVEFDLEAAVPTVTVVTADGTRAVHHRAPHGWHIELQARHARSSVDLEGLVPSPEPQASQPKRPVQGDAAVLVPTVSEDAIGAVPGSRIDGSLSMLLDEPHYVRTDASWREADCPTAVVQLAATSTEFLVDVDVRTGGIVCNAMPTENPLDNERADINSDGLQWYLAEAYEQGWVAGALIVPAEPHAARVTALVPGMSVHPKVDWVPTVTGWAIRLRWRRELLPRGNDGTVRFDLVINERPVDRERRRGQLVLSGGGGFGYLRGDRHEPARSLRLSLV